MRSYANIYKHICDGLNKNVLYRLLYLNTYSLDGGEVWRGYGTFRRHSLAGQSGHWRLTGFESQLEPHSQFALCLCRCVRMR